MDFTHLDLESEFESVGLGSDGRASLLAEIRSEFPEDDFQFELHVFRALQAERFGIVGPKAWLERLRHRSHPSQTLTQMAEDFQ